jgi:YggT family protein
VNIINNLLNILLLLIILDVILSWAMMLGARGISAYHPWVRTLHSITYPVLEPFRRLVPPRMLNGFDISPILAYVVIQFIRHLL